MAYEKNLQKKVDVEIVLNYRVDSKGRQAIRYCIKKKGDEFFLIAVNTIETHLEAVIRLDDLGIQALKNSRIEECKEIFSEVRYPVIKGGLLVKFKPFETKVFVSEAGGK